MRGLPLLLAALAMPAFAQTGAPAEKKAGGAAPAQASPPLPTITPPGLDMDPAKRAAVVAEHLKAAKAALRAKDADKAISEARIALEADETHVASMIALAYGYYLKGYDDKAEAILLIAKKRPEGEQDAVLWMLIGLIAERGTERMDEALASYEKAAQLKPDYAAALTNAGAIYLERRRYADALTTFEKVVRLQPRSAAAHTNLGSACRGRSADFVQDQAKRDELLQKSEVSFKQAMAIDPGHAAAFFNYGVLLLDADPFPGLETLKRLENAMKYLNEYKRLAGVNLKAGDPVDDYLAAAQKAHDREVKKIEAKKRREEAERKKREREAAKKAAEGAQPAQPAPQPEGGGQ